VLKRKENRMYIGEHLIVYDIYYNTLAPVLGNSLGSSLGTSFIKGSRNSYKKNRKEKKMEIINKIECILENR
jgi:hypothetical protein